MRLYLFTLLVTLLLPTALLADTYTYTYTGNSFTQILYGTDYTTSDSLSGSFTLSAPLAANSDQTIVPIAGEFTDGVAVSFNLISSDPNVTISGMDVTTDSNGNIDGWDFIFFLQGGQFAEIQSVNEPDGNTRVEEDITAFSYPDNNLQEARNVNDPGSWVQTVNSQRSAVTPEPSAILLLGTGLLGTAGVFKRRMIP